jgi:hypothetical protein
MIEYAKTFLLSWRFGIIIWPLNFKNPFANNLQPNNKFLP